MGWRSTLRTIEAAGRRAQRANAAHARQSERHAARRRSELLRQHREMQAADAVARAQYEVAMFDNYLDLIVSLHKDAWSVWNWHQLAMAPPPPPEHPQEQAAVVALQGYRPGLVERATGKDQVMRQQLEAAVLVARQQDHALHQFMVEQWDWYRRVGGGVLRGELAAYQAVLEHLMPFDELEQLGTSVSLRSEAPWYAEADVRVRDAEVIPSEEIKLGAGGKVSTKAMAKGRYWELYQDHVCSAALRVGRELFALLPIESAFVHLSRPGVNTATGNDELQVILSVRLDRGQFMKLNFDRLDASDAVSGFENQMKFKKTTGFSTVEALGVGNNLVSQ